VVRESQIGPCLPRIPFFPRACESQIVQKNLIQLKTKIYVAKRAHPPENLIKRKLRGSRESNVNVLAKNPFLRAKRAHPPANLIKRKLRGSRESNVNVLAKNPFLRAKRAHPSENLMNRTFCGLWESNVWLLAKNPFSMWLLRVKCKIYVACESQIGQNNLI
jgi:hypothetical protein